MERKRRKPAIPTAEEAQKIIPMIREAFAAEGVEPAVLGEHPRGGVMARAKMTSPQKGRIVTRLFEQGIVMVATAQADAFGFAVMRLRQARPAPSPQGRGRGRRNRKDDAMDEFFTKRTCDRCGGSLVGGRTMSMFNEQTICMICADAERKRADYGRACEAERTAVKAGDRDFKGVACRPGGARTGRRRQVLRRAIDGADGQQTKRQGNERKNESAVLGQRLRLVGTGVPEPRNR